MNNDLISRKAVFSYLQEKQNNMIIEHNSNGVLSESEYSIATNVISTFMNFVLGLPTAFDKEKVMDELHDASDLNTEDGLWHVNLRHALEIVEKGGIE